MPFQVFRNKIFKERCKGLIDFHVGLFFFPHCLEAETQVKYN